MTLIRSSLKFGSKFAMKSKIVKKLEEGRHSWNLWRQAQASEFPDLSRAVLTGMNLSGYNLTGCRFIATDFIDANLEDADLTGSDCRRARFIAASLKGTNFDSAELEGADFLTAVVSRIGLSGLDLRNVNLTSFDLRNACLDRANLQGVDLSGFDLSGSSLKGTLLSGANLRNCNISNVDFNGANLENASLEKSNLRASDLTNVKAMSACFTQVNASNSLFIGADLRNCDLTSGDFNGSDFTNSLLAGIHTKLWSIKKIKCKSCSWDQKGKELDKFKRGDFERLYGDRPTFSIFYPNCIQPQELVTLPFLIEHLAASKWGCFIQLQSLLHLPGKTEVTLSIEGTGSFEPSELLTALQQEAEQLQLAQLELRNNRKLQAELKTSLSSLKEKFWPRMLELAAEQQANQQRYLTVMFMDLKDFSKWPEAEMASRLELFRGLLKPVLNRWQAVFPNMEGDSLRVTFHHSTIAVHCALMIQKVLTAAGFHLRIGMDMGPLQVRHNDVTGVSDLGGAALNFAARLENLAKPGEVLVTERVRHFARELSKDLSFRTHKLILNKAVGDLELGSEITCYRVIENA